MKATCLKGRFPAPSPPWLLGCLWSPRTESGGIFSGETDPKEKTYKYLRVGISHLSCEGTQAGLCLQTHEALQSTSLVLDKPGCRWLRPVARS